MDEAEGRLWICGREERERRNQGRAWVPTCSDSEEDDALDVLDDRGEGPWSRASGDAGSGNTVLVCFVGDIGSVILHSKCAYQFAMWWMMFSCNCRLRDRGVRLDQKRGRCGRA